MRRTNRASPPNEYKWSLTLLVLDFIVVSSGVFYFI